MGIQTDGLMNDSMKFSEEDEERQKDWKKVLGKDSMIWRYGVGIPRGKIYCGEVKEQMQMVRKQWNC